MSQETNEWDGEIVEVSTAEFDDAVKKMMNFEEIRDTRKEALHSAQEDYDRQRHFVLSLLQKTNKTKYHIENIGTISRVVKYSVGMPKDPDLKKKVLDYFKNLGDDVFDSTVSIYYQTLNSYYNSMRENDPNFTIDGIGEPARNEELRFRKG